ncbi:MAG TPA: hypothetical protein VGL61_33945 [Kofleriaceae bacterium]|jgi:hypothetical protein
MILFGGKGSGKTHLMRYLSYPLQLSRSQALADVINEGYLGLYFRCSGLNAQRFAGKRQSPEVWAAVFSYYLELWLGQLVLSTAAPFLPATTEQRPFVEKALRLLDVPPAATSIGTGADLLVYLEDLQRACDVAINNCALTHTLDVRIQATSGHLVFGLPRVLAECFPHLQSVLFVYLIDELENLSEAQQRYIHTLLRERKDPCSFKVGVRLYGIRTYQTLGDEINHEDAEYEALRLDRELRDRPDLSEFAANLVSQRLKETGYAAVDSSQLASWFEEFDETKFAAELHAKYAKQGGSPHIHDLNEKLTRAAEQGSASGIRKRDIAKIITLLSNPDPILEKANCMLLYRAWHKRTGLLEAAESIAQSAEVYNNASSEDSEHQILRHFRGDIIAQLLKESRLPARYLGFKDFVSMSSGLPRGLLTILKHVFTWSNFYGEHPFREGQISAKAQAEGVKQASEWFFTEARAPGAIGGHVREAMTRLGQLLRAIRFSDKPSECSLSTFSVDAATVSPDALRVITTAEDWSMLLRVAGGQVDRNEGRVDDKYQVHPMLAPRWDLPIVRRGALVLSGDEANAIFAPSSPADFESVLRRRSDAMNAPFGRKGNQEPMLPGLERE